MAKEPGSEPEPIPGSISSSYLKTVIGPNGQPEVIRVFEFFPYPPKPKQPKNNRTRHSG